MDRDDARLVQTPCGSAVLVHITDILLVHSTLKVSEPCLLGFTVFMRRNVRGSRGQDWKSFFKYRKPINIIMNFLFISGLIFFQEITDNLIRNKDIKFTSADQNSHLGTHFNEQNVLRKV